jgi:PAS domain S-box-containing protein
MVLVAGVPALLAAAWHMRQDTLDARAAAEADVASSARHVAGLVAEHVQNLDLALAAATRGFDRAAPDAAALEALRRTLPSSIVALEIEDASGNSRAATLAPVAPPLRDAIAGAVARARATGRLAFAGPVRVEGRGWVVIAARGVRDGPARGSTLVALERQSRLQDLLQAAGPAARRVAGIVDEQGRVLARAPDPERWLGQPRDAPAFVARRGALSPVERRGLDGVTRLYAAEPIAAARWTAYVGIPRDVALAQVRTRVTLVAVVGLGALLLSLLMAWSLAQRLTRPLRQLQLDASILGAGHLAHRSQVRSGDEVGRLAETFNNMAAALADRELALHESRERVAVILRSIADGVIVTDAAGRVRFMNPVAEAMSGWREVDALGRPLPEVFAATREATGEPLPDLVRQVVERGVVVAFGESTALARPQRPRIPIEVSGSPIRDAREHISGVVVAFHDISEQRRGERESAELASIVQSTDDAIVGVTPDGTIASWNAGARVLYGYVPEEALGRRLSVLAPEGRAAEVEALLARARAGEPVQGVESERLTRDGRVLAVSLTLSPTRDALGRVTGVSEIARDISERRRLEARLRESQKLEAVGRLAGGLAQDFHQRLETLLGHCRRGLVEIAARRSGREALEEIERLALRANARLGPLMVFSRRRRVRLRPVDVGALLLEMQRMIERMIGDDVRLTLTLDQKLGAALADPVALQHVVLQLALNARDAMPDGGRLSIETSETSLEPSDLRQHPDLAPGRYAVITVCDTGAGMDESTREQLFEPFFTTKAEASAAGSGLAMVYGIVRQCGGAVGVVSAPGSGSTFRVLLPRADAPDLPFDAASSQLPTGKECVLLAEDDPMLLRLTADVLRDFGYRVIAASSGQDALDKARIEPDVDLLLTDIVMPGMSGRALAERLAGERPGLRVLYITGYAEHLTPSGETEVAGGRVLEKPFTPSVLARAVRETLDAPAPAPTAEG